VIGEVVLELLRNERISNVSIISRSSTISLSRLLRRAKETGGAKEGVMEDARKVVRPRGKLLQ
jgi:hypothetical protein